MGVATGCGFKEIYRFPHTTYPYSSSICTFLQQHPYFFVHFVNVFTFLYIYKLFGKSVDFKQYLHGVCDAGSRLLFKFRSGTHGLNEEASKVVRR